MRHVGDYNLKINNLSQFKKTIYSIFQQITHFNKQEKVEALNYVRQFTTKRCTAKTSNAKIKQSDTKSTSVVTLNKSIPSTVTALKCEICNVTKRTELGLFKHIESHKGTPISCTICSQSFNNKVAFNWHSLHFCSKPIAAKKKLSCPECPRKFKFKRHLIIHRNGHVRNNCPHCGKVLTKRQHLQEHMLLMHQIKLETRRFSCVICDKKFVRRQSLYCHQRLHFPTKHICLECGKIENHQNKLNIHIKQHHEEKLWRCKICKEKFSRQQQYLNHVKRHSFYKCLTCKKSYSSKKQTTVHLKLGHIVQGLEPKLHCPYCPTAYHRLSALQQHLKKHKDKSSGPFVCKFCDSMFKNLHQYYKHCSSINHQNSTSEKDRLACENCGKQFTCKVQLTQHLRRIHPSKQLLFSCEHCNFTTSFKANLERHVKLHFQNSPQFICHLCGKMFSNSNSLTDHIDYIHVQEKRFSCTECNKSFKRNSELVRHQSSHSSTRPYVCNLCNHTYKRSSHLRRHQETTHKINLKSKKVRQLIPESNDAVFRPGSRAENKKIGLSKPTSFET